MNRILKEDRNISITNSRKIVDTRNYIYMVMTAFLPISCGV